MASVIDALFITLGLDTKDYEKKRKEVDASLKKFGEASDKQTKLIAESGKKAAGAFSALKIEILGALAAFGMGAGFKAFIESSMNGQAAAGRMADALGISVQSMQAYKLMAAEMGESGDAAVGTLNKVAAGMAAARRGDVSFLSKANQYGAGLTLNDDVETTMSKLNRMAYAIREKYGRQQAMGVLGEIGIGDFLQQQQLMESPAKYAADYAEALRHGSGMTQQSIEQAKELQRQWAFFMRDMEALRNRVFAKLEPVLIKLGKQLADFLDHVDWDKVIEKVGEFFTKLQQVVQALGGVKGILIEIAAIKVFGWIANVGVWVLKLRSLTTALTAARAAAAAGGAAGAAEGAAAAGGAGVASKVIPLATRISMWALPIWALFHSESTGGKRRANGTYEDEFDWSSPEGQAAIAKQKAAEKTAATRGMRNNNPGNIKYGAFARSLGATGQDLGGFAIFPTAQQGIAAIAANLRSYGRKGFDTPSEIAHRWSTTDQAAYTKTLAALFGGNANKQLDMTNKSVIAALTNAIISQENGANPYLGMVNAHVGAPRGTQAKTTTNTSTVSIGTMNVNAPRATDADGIAKGAQKAMRDNPLIAGSVTALA